jgi:hypothetical protein
VADVDLAPDAAADGVDEWLALVAAGREGTTTPTALTSRSDE